MIRLHTKEETRKIIENRINKSLEKERKGWSSGDKYCIITYIKEEIDLIKEICQEKGLTFKHNPKQKWTLPITYEGYIYK